MSGYTVYLLRTADERVYLGATSTNLRTRWKKGNGYRFIPELWEHIRAEGWDSVEREILASGLTKDEASLAEQRFIELYHSYDPAFGYNKELGGLGGHKRWSDTSRKKMSESVTGFRNHNYGTHFAYEHRQKLSESNTGQKRSSETCINIGKAKEKAVVQYSTSGKLLGVWDSGRKAALATGVAAHVISKACIGKLKTGGGFVWKYAN